MSIRIDSSSILKVLSVILNVVSPANLITIMILTDITFNKLHLASLIERPIAMILNALNLIICNLSTSSLTHSLLTLTSLWLYRHLAWQQGFKRWLWILSWVRIIYPPIFLSNFFSVEILSFSGRWRVDQQFISILFTDCLIDIDLTIRANATLAAARRVLIKYTFNVGPFFDLICELESVISLLGFPHEFFKALLLWLLSIFI